MSSPALLCFPAQMILLKKAQAIILQKWLRVIQVIQSRSHPQNHNQSGIYLNGFIFYLKFSEISGNDSQKVSFPDFTSYSCIPCIAILQKKHKYICPKEYSSRN